MKLEQSFEVSAPLERVWAAMVDVQRVAPCLPGAEVSGRNDDGSYDGTFKVKIGPTAAAYVGKLRMEQVDETAHTATMDAQGTDRRGQGGATATIVSSVARVGDGVTRVDVSTEYHITGRLARFGRGGMIEEISNRLLRQFATSLQEMLAGDGAAAAEAEASAAAAVAGVGQGPEAVVAGSAPAVAPGPVVAGSAPAVAPGPAPDPGRAAAPAPPPAASEPVQGLSLVGSVVWSRARSNPLAIAAAAGGALLVARMLRRRRN